MECVVRVIASPGSWIEGEAVRQLEETSRLPGMRMAVGMPDLHPGRGNPIGAAFVCDGHVYPHLVGSDIGCGMALFRTDVKGRKAKIERWAKRLEGLEGPWDGDPRARLAAAGIAPTAFDASLGTIGGGNHFAELQAVESIADADAFAALGLDAEGLVLLVHSGSRGYGESILRAHVARHGASGVAIGSAEATEYLAAHDHAVAWGHASRALIAERFAEGIGAAIAPVLDVCHNAVVPCAHEGAACWLHRKGAAPADVGAVMIPGSRGDFSYLVMPAGPVADGAWGASLAHGAGRKWTRGDARRRVKERFRAADLTRTKLGGHVICEDKELLYEEAPEAYKAADAVVGDLVSAGFARIVAVFRPRLTYKVRRARDLE